MDDAPTPIRRQSREPDDSRAEIVTTLTPTTPVAEPTLTAGAAIGHTVASPRRAFAWVDEALVASAPTALRTLDAAGSPYLPAEADLLATRPRRSLLRAGVIVPIMVLAALVGAYSATTLLWPLHAVPPVVEAVTVQPAPAAPALVTWPSVGSASVAVAGIGEPLASAAEPVPIASITKIVTALLVLEEMPLAVGEQGPGFAFTSADRSAYWGYRENGESALDVPVGGELSEYQLLQGMLIGSANNYADRLAGNLWPSDAVFASAARAWLTAHGVPDVTVVEPTGLASRNAASPSALIPLAKLAMANPVIAQIVAMPSVDLPGAGPVVNTNTLLADPGVVGIKTGSLDSYNLLSAKDLVVGDTTVRVYASVLGQPDDESRVAASRQLYSDVELGLQPAPSVAAGTVAGHVTTPWGEAVDIVTAQDASVILWNSAVPSVTTSFTLGDERDEASTVGALSVQGPLNAGSTPLVLADEIDLPSPWWRLTHPLELFGLS